MARTFLVRDAERTDRRAFLATPSYAGTSSPYDYSLTQSREALRRAGWSVDYLHMEGNCHVDDGRNFLVRAFLETDCTDFVFLDADIGWQADDLLKLLSFDRDVVAGVYPKKRDGSDYPAQLPPGEIWADADGLIRANRVPTGFLRLRRNVVQALYDSEPRRFRGTKDGPDRLPQAIIFERTWVQREDGLGDRISGDYSCCDRIRKLGFDIWVDPEMRFVHEGPHEWEGSFGDDLRQKAGIANHYAVKAVEAMRAGTATLADFAALVKEYGNQAFSATPELLYSLYLSARDVRGPMLETGTGLSSIVLGVVSEMTGNPALSLEHEKGWLVETRKMLAALGLKHRPTFAPLDRDESGVWYSAEVPDNLALVLCDGPQRHHGRSGLFSRHGANMSNAIIILDDYETEQHLVEEWLPDREMTVLGTARPFVVLAPKRAAEAA